MSSIYENSTDETSNLTNLKKEFQGINAKAESLLKPIKHKKFLSNNDLLDITSMKKTLNNITTTKPDNDDCVTSTSKNYINKFIKMFSCKSRAGNTIDGNRKTNQDSYMAKSKCLNNEEYCIFGVYDGHGTIITFK